MNTIVLFDKDRYRKLLHCAQELLNPTRNISLHSIEEELQLMQEWFTDAKLGIFIHWGIYSVKGVAESWSFYHGKISYEDYMAQKEGFTASDYDPEEWAELFKKVGAKYAVMTTKHHDGVALWDTKLNLTRWYWCYLHFIRFLRQSIEEKISLDNDTPTSSKTATSGVFAYVFNVG